MPNTFPTTQIDGVALSSANYALLNNLNIFDRSFEKSLVRIYGPENYAIVQMALGNSVMEAKTDNRSFYHYEKRGLHQFFTVNAAITNPSAGAAVTVTLGTGSYFNSGTQSPVRVGEVVRIMTSGIEGMVTAVNKTTANAHTATITPLVSTQAFVSASSSNLLAGEYLLMRGAVNVGEQSAKLDGISPLLDKITNTTTEHRDDYTITDRAASERNEVDFGNGQHYYYYLAQDDMNRRYMNNAFFKIMEGVAVNNLSNGTVGTVGVIPRVAANGSTIQYTASSGPQISDLHTLCRTLNFYGGSGEYHFLQDIYQRQAVNDLLFGKYNNGAIRYASVGGSEEASVSYGFNSFSIDGYTFHFFLNNMFSPEAVYQINPGVQVPEKRNYGLLIPQRINNDAKTGKQFPSFQIVFQEVGGQGGQRILTWETGALAPQNKTTDANKTISMLSYIGARTFAAPQYAIFQGL